jgi:DNA-binding MarR family transcriptional regulator
VIPSLHAMTHFTPENFHESQIGLLLGRTNSLKDRFLDQHLEVYGVTSAQFKVLIIVAEWGLDSPGDLCRHLSLDSGSMTRMLDRLESKQLIRRSRSEEDRRQIRIALTAEGKALAARLPHIGAQAMNRLAGALDAAELQELERLLKKILIDAGDPVACWRMGKK